MINVSYRVQAADTQIEAELMQFGLWRAMSSAQKLALIKRTYQKGCQLILMGIQRDAPGLTGVDFKRLWLQKRWGNEGNRLAAMLNLTGEWMLADPIFLIRELVLLFDHLHIPYYVSGSVASSLQGEVRFTEDLDVAIAIDPDQVNALIASFSPAFYISEVAVNEAIQGKISSFNVIHLETVEKADIFISGADEFSLSKMARRQWYEFDTDTGGFYVSSPEDTILQKLLWSQSSHSEKQWRDVLGVLKLQGSRLDFAYLAQWGDRLGVKLRLAEAVRESGLTDYWPH